MSTILNGASADIDVLAAARSRVEAVLARTTGDDAARERQVRFQELTAELATGFIGLTGTELENALGSALERIASFTGAERAILARLVMPGETLLVTHEWSKGAPASVLRDIHGHRAMQWSMAQLRTGRLLHFENVDDLPPEAVEERLGWDIFGLQSILAVPVRTAHGDLLGFAVFVTATRKAGWRDEDMPLFELAGELFRSTFEQQSLRVEMERSELRLRKLLESGAIGILSVANDGRILEANDSALHVIGVTREYLEAGKLRWDALTPPEFLPMTMGAFEQVERAGCSAPWEQDIYRPDGSRVSVLICIARIAESPDHFLAYAVDITVDKRAKRELALRHRLARLVTLFSTRMIAVAPTAINETIQDALRETGNVLGIDRCSVWLDVEGTDGIARCTNAWDRNRPKPKLDLIPQINRHDFGKWMDDFQNRRPMIVRDIEQDFPEGSTERTFLELHGVRSGVAVSLIGSESPIGFVTFASGQVVEWSENTVSLLCVIGEIFAAAILRGRTEGRQHRVHAELEQQIAERTTQLASANRELESFSYAVSHDLRAPLRSVDGFSRILVEDHAEGLPEGARTVIERIRVTSQKMGDLIDALLRLSRITRLEPQFEETDLSAVVHELALSLATAEPERRVEFSIRDNVVVDGEPRLLAALMDNLLRNSWKFTSSRARAHIEFGVEETPGGPVYFVRDDGIGFEPSQAERIFMPFQRLHDPREFEGHGVGLATVKRIVGIHGGRVSAKGEPGKGATVRFTLGKRA